MNFGMMKQLQQLQSKMAKVQADLAQETVEASVGGGAVTVTITGHMKVQAVKIAPEVVDPADVAMLEDLMLAAINEAVERAQKLGQERMASVTGGLKIPGLG